MKTEFQLLTQLKSEYDEDGEQYFYEIREEVEVLYNQDGVNQGKIPDEERGVYASMLRDTDAADRTNWHKNTKK